MSEPVFNPYCLLSTLADTARPLDAERMMQLIQTINLSSQGKTVAIARVPSVDSHLVTHALDAGKIPTLSIGNRS